MVHLLTICWMKTGIFFATFAVTNFYLTAKYAKFNAEFAMLMFPPSFAIFA